MDLLDGHGIEVVDPLPAVFSTDHEPTHLQHTQMLHDREPGVIRELVRQLPGGARAIAQEIQDLSADWVGQGPPNRLK